MQGKYNIRDSRGRFTKSVTQQPQKTNTNIIQMTMSAITNLLGKK